MRSVADEPQSVNSRKGELFKRWLDCGAMADAAQLRTLVAAGALDADLAAVLAVLAEHGLRDRWFSPLPRLRMPDGLRRALAASAGGVVVADSLDAVLRLAGAPFGALPDAARDLGVVVVHDGRRVTAAHYLRPVERDVQGHLQRRPPATLGAWNEREARFDHYGWAIHDELATRAGLSLDDFDAALVRWRRELAAGARA